MRYNTKHIEEHHEDLFVGFAKLILTNDNKFLNCLQSDSRHVDWLNSQKYGYMRNQIDVWVGWLKEYNNNLNRIGKCVTKVIDYEVTGRIKGEKTDVIFIISDGTQDNISLKTIKKGSQIQTNSSTFFSFLLSFIFDKNGVGNFLFNDDTFSTRSIKKIRTYLVEKGYDEDFINNLFILKNTSKELRSVIMKYPNFFNMVYNGKNNTYKEGLIDKSAWVELCEDYREKYKSLMVNMINDIIKIEDKVLLNKRVMMSQGILGEHKTIVITQTECYELTHEKIDINNIKFTITESNGGLICNFKSDMVNINSTIPFTINRNGSYNLDKDRDNEYFKTDKQRVPFGMIRPIKSKQIATSTNTYIKIDNLL